MLELEKKTSPWRRAVLVALVGVCAFGTVFGAGFFVGRWSTRSNSSNPSLLGRILSVGGHGAVGRISQIEGTTITLRLRGGAMEIILTDSQTRVEGGLVKPSKLALRDLKVDDQIIVVGAPNAQGQIKAKLIRVLNAPVLTPTPTGL